MRDHTEETLRLVRDVDLVTGLVTVQMTPGSFVSTE